VVRSADLFGNARTLTIAHKDEAYRLQITATGKLILTK
jgi:hemin uptake protein HemP